MEDHLPSLPKSPLFIVDEMHDVLQQLRADDRSAATVDELLTELVRQGRRPVAPVAPVLSPFTPHRLADFDGPKGIPVDDPEPEPVYWFCNSCGEEVEDETAECCADGEIEPSYDEPTT
ncbi:hypothetical protein ACFQ77_21895 [Streptomyces virginiae]|uniref:hypothetical protein n=1 Tax=Streptomyces virginiae TaxID=1961 RepID=UPI00368FB3DB